MLVVFLAAPIGACFTPTIDDKIQSALHARLAFNISHQNRVNFLLIIIFSTSLARTASVPLDITRVFCPFSPPLAIQF
jgi:hypothetical protein